MGIGASVVPASDARVNKCMKKLSMSESEVSSLFMKFSILDRDGLGLMTREDFFVKFIEEERTFFGDAIFNLIEPANEEVLTFGEFMEGVCLYSLFETTDVLRLVFAVFDTDQTGFVTKDDIKHFIMELHHGDLKSNAQIGMHRIESRKKTGLLSFKDICDLHRTFPSLLFPIFRLQNTIIRMTFSESWWSHKKVILAEQHRINRKLEEALAANGKVDEAELARQAMDKLVQEQMGTLLYYLTPWNRIRMQMKIEKRKIIEAQLLEKEEQDVAEAAAEEALIKLQMG